MSTVARTTWVCPLCAHQVLITMATRSCPATWYRPAHVHVLADPANDATLADVHLHFWSQHPDEAPAPATGVGP